MILSTLSTVPKHAVIEHYGVVSGSTVRTRNAFRDLFANVKNFFGGELKGYTRLLNEAREHAMERMIDQAHQQGANAILNIRMTTGAVAKGAAEIYMYGTAVKIEPHS